MSPRPTVTVIVPTFNRPTLLPRTLESLRMQTFRDFEVVVVNDGGVDPGPVVAAHRGELDVRVVQHPTNRGVTAAQNTGIAHARGRFVGFLADDDLYYPHHLETVCGAAAAAPPGAVVYTDGLRVVEDAEGRPVERAVLPVPPEFDRDVLLVTNYVPGTCLLLPSDAITEVGGFAEELPVLEDWDLWLRISARRPFLHVPVTTLEYRVRGGRENLTTREWFRFHDALQRVYERHPVPADGAMAVARRQMLEGSAPRADAQLYDTSVLVVSDGDPASLLTCLDDVAGALGDASYEVLVHAPRTDATTTIASAVDGDFTMVLGDVNADDAAAVLARRASGRRHVVVRTGHPLPDALAAAYTTSARH